MGIMRRGRRTSVLLGWAVAALTLIPGRLDAASSSTSCALSGLYTVSAGVVADSPGQLSGRFTFTPPASCTAGAAGEVSVDVSVWLQEAESPTASVATLAYTVASDGTLTIGTNQLRGRIGAVNDKGVANSLALEADPGFTGGRFAGTASRVDLAGNAATLDAYTDDYALALAARPICFTAASLVKGSVGDGLSVVMLKYDPGVSDVQTQCTTKINGGWHACGVAKVFYHDVANHQGCDASTSLDRMGEFGGIGYAGFSTRSVWQQKRTNGDLNSCNSHNAVVCCSPQCQ
jgi:hypothetical protein